MTIIASILIFIFEVISFWTIWKILDLTFNHKIEKIRQHFNPEVKDKKETFTLKISEDTRKSN